MEALQLSGALVDLTSGRFVRRGAPGTLGPRQLRLLKALVEHPSDDRSRDALLAEAWDGDGSPRAVDAAVRTLRRALEQDPAAPGHILTVHGVGYRFEPAPAPEPAEGLPGGLDPFFGRGAQLFAIGEAFAAGDRLVALVGPAGVGKTRLALRFAAARRCHGLEGGRSFVELAEERTVAGVTRVLADALDVPGGPGLDRRLEAVLAGRGPILVVLDNLEQLPAGTGPLVRRWADAAPEVRWLLTSQRPPEGGPTVVRIGPLAVAPAESLFVHRARATGERAPLPPDPVRRICDRLDRLPLAVELAAARVPVLGLKGLDDRLERSLELLVAGARPRPRRHLTLEASIRWSWDLLPPPDQEALARCSVFRGPFSRSAAAAIGAPALEALVDSSLVLQRGDDGVRLSLPVRSFAADRLTERRDADEAAQAHARWYEARSAALVKHVNTAGEGPAAAKAWGELPNLRAALETLARTDTDAALQMALELNRLVRPRSSRELQAELLAIALAGADERTDPDLRSMAAAVWAVAAFEQGDPSAPSAMAAACERAVGRRARAFVLSRAGDMARQQGHTELATSQLETAAAEAGAVGDGSLRSQALVYLGIVRESRGRLDDAADLFGQALAEAHRVGNLRVVGVCATNLAIVARRRGDRPETDRYGKLAIDAYSQLGSPVYLAEMTLNRAVADLSFCDATAARAGLLQARTQLRAVGDAIGETLAISNLGMAHLMLGSRREAIACFTEGAELHRRAATGRYEAYARLSLGLAHYLEGELEAATEALDRARALFQQSGDVAPHAVTDAVQALVEDERGGPSETLRQAALERIAGTTQQEAARAVKVLCGLEEPGPNRDSYDWMASAALAARASRSQSRSGSGTE